MRRLRPLAKAGASRLVPRPLAALAAVLMLASSFANAHEGESHEPAAETSAAAPASLRPRPQPDGSLRIDKPLQHALGLRTVLWSAEAATTTQRLPAEVIARPELAQQVVAAEAGRLEPPAEGWPLPGQRLRRGQVLAWLRPALSQRDIAERRATIADLDQKLVMSALTVERMRMQRTGAEDRAATGNVYYEQSQAEHDALSEQRRLLLDSLEGRRPLRAPADGRLSSVRAAAGELAVQGQVLFELAGTQGLRLVVTTWEPTIAARLRDARLMRSGAPLILRGVEPLREAPGWQLLFDAPDAGGLNRGELAEVELAVADPAAALPATACALDASGRARIWLHAEAERYVPVNVGRCEAPRLAAALPAAARIVVDGAALLSAY